MNGVLNSTVAAFSVSSLSNDVILRQGRKEDEGLISTTMMKSLMNPLNIDARRFLVAEEKNEDNDTPVIVGWAQLRPLDKDNEDSWELASVYVNPMYRKRGIGTQLVRQLINQKQEQSRNPEKFQVYALTLDSTFPWYHQLGFEKATTNPPPSMKFEIEAGQIITKFLGETLICIRWNPQS